MRRPKPGDQYRTAEAVASGPLVDEVVTVREMVKAASPGAHDDSEDAVVVEWEEPGLVLTETGVTVRGEVSRAMSFSLSDIDSRFKKV